MKTIGIIGGWAGTFRKNCGRYRIGPTVDSMSRQPAILPVGIQNHYKNNANRSAGIIR